MSDIDRNQRERLFFIWRTCPKEKFEKIAKTLYDYRKVKRIMKEDKWEDYSDIGNPYDNEDEENVEIEHGTTSEDRFLKKLEDLLGTGLDSITEDQIIELDIEDRIQVLQRINKIRIDTEKWKEARGFDKGKEIEIFAYDPREKKAKKKN